MPLVVIPANAGIQMGAGIQSHIHIHLHRKCKLLSALFEGCRKFYSFLKAVFYNDSPRGEFPFFVRLGSILYFFMRPCKVGRLISRNRAAWLMLAPARARAWWMAFFSALSRASFNVYSFRSSRSSKRSRAGIGVPVPKSSRPNASYRRHEGISSTQVYDCCSFLHNFYYSIVHAGAHKGVHWPLITRFVKGQHQLIELQPSLRWEIDRGISVAQQMTVHNEPSHP